MSEYFIKDNFLNQEEFLKIQTFMLSNEFPWYFQKNISDAKNQNIIDFGFAHLFYDKDKINSGYFEKMLHLVNSICVETNTTKLLRIRGDMTVNVNKDDYYEPHNDTKEDHIVSIFYLTDSEAPTIIFNNTTKEEPLIEMALIEPKENRLLVFNGKYVHTGMSPKKTQRRVIINVNTI